MGYGPVRKTFNENRNRLHFSEVANVLMKYRLCDIMAWMGSEDEVFNVPIHSRRSFKVLSKSVSCFYSNGVSAHFVKKDIP